MIKKVITLDWRAMKYYQVRGLLLPLVGFFAGVIYSPVCVIPFLTYIGISFSVNPFAVEEKGELNNLYLTLPLERRQIVKGRYAFSLIILLSSIAMGIPIMALSNTISFSKYFIGIQGVAVIVSLCILMYSILNISMFPTLFKLGYQKGKIWGFYLPAILFAVIFGVYYVFSAVSENKTVTIDFIAYASDNLMPVSVLCIILAAAIELASYMLSNRIYKKRDF